MIEGSQKSKMIARAQAMVNIGLMVILAFYVCHSLASAYMAVSYDPDMCWLSWLTISLCSFVLFTLQLTTDLFLFKNMNDTFQAIRKCEQWLRMSILFIAFLVFALLFSLVCDPGRQWASPKVFFFLIMAELICRVVGIFIVRNYVAELRKSVESDQVYFITSVSTPTPTPTPSTSGTCRNV